jgi:glycosyltransferase involved in cell wall biosynthesis
MLAEVPRYDRRVPPPRSILLVAHVTPPVPMSAARRAAGLTKHLSRLGHRVTVLTSAMSGTGSVPGANRTIRTRDLLVSPLNWRRSSFAALKGESSGAYVGTPSAFAAWVIPDLELIGWVPFALPRALALAKREHFDCVITSSPPQSAHLIGLALQRRGIPWVADLRDGWSFEPSGERFPPGRRRRLDQKLEETVLSRADGAVGVTPPIGDDLRHRVNPRAVTITNGFDPDEFAAAVEAAARAPVEPRRFTVAYTGTLAYGGTSAGPLLDGFRRLRDQDPAAAERLELVFAGPMSSADLAELEASDLDGAVRVVGALSRAESLGLQRAADALALFVDSRRPSIATGKLYEYLSSGRRILVLGEGSVAARIVSEIGAGVVVPSEDPAAIAAALGRLVRDVDATPAPPRAAIERFSYARLAADMAEQVELAIARQGSTAGASGYPPDPCVASPASCT